MDTGARTAGHVAVNRPDPHSQTVLVVEDEISYREALLVALSREGYDVQLASDGIEALETLRRATS